MAAFVPANAGVARSRGKRGAGVSKHSSWSRSSCDRCRTMKLGCSHDRPACARCVSRGLDCVYGLPVRVVKTQLSKPEPHRQASARQEEHTETVSPDGHVKSPSNVGKGFAGDHMDGELNMDATPSTMHGTISSVETPSTEPRSDGCSSDHRFSRTVTLQLSPNVDSVPPSPSLLLPPIHVPIDSVDASPQHLPNLLQHSEKHASNASCNCYLAVLEQSAKTERLLAGLPQPCSLDMVLRAEGDLRTLQHAVLTCARHSPRRLETFSESAPDTPQVLLSLAALADRVIGLLENSTHIQHPERTIARSPQQTRSGTSPRKYSFRALLQEAAARHTVGDSEGAFPPMRLHLPPVLRSSSVANCSGSPAGEHHYVVDGVAKTRATDAIIRGRMKQMLGLLGEMQDMAKMTGPHDMATDQETGRAGVKGLGPANSRSVLGDAAAELMGDLVRRVEEMVGRLALQR